MGSHRRSTGRSGTGRRTRRTTGPALWGAGLVAAGVLAASVDGTLSSWTSAVVGNTTNTAATARAVILTEASGAATCRSSTAVSNAATCTTIDAYGGSATPLAPGTSQTVTLTFTNAGSATGATFALAPGGCTQSPAAGSGSVPATDLCTTAGELTVAVACSAGSSYTAAAAWTDLAYSAAVAPTATRTHTAVTGELAAGATWTCQLTVALAAGAAVADQGITVTQALTWTLAS